MSGPYETRNQAGANPEVRAVRDRFAEGASAGMTTGKLAILTSACDEAGVVLGAYDRRVLERMAGADPEECASAAGIVRRAYGAGRAAGPEMTAGQRQGRAAELAAPLLEMSADDWLYLRLTEPGLIARLKTALSAKGGA